MGRHLIIYRLFEALFTLFVIATILFLILRLLPGGPFDDQISLNPVVKQEIEKSYGLNENLITQYLIFIKNMAVFDLGESMFQPGVRVVDIIKSTIFVSACLGFMALVSALFFGVWLGLWSVYKGGWAHWLYLGISWLGLCLPLFLLGPLLVLFFSFYIPILPAALLESPWHYVLPVLTLSLRPLSLVARIIRSETQKVLQADYTRTARAKGLSRKKIIFNHALREALLPTMGFLGPMAASLLTGTFIVETIFAIPGLGVEFVRSVADRDYPVVISLSLFYAVILVSVNLLSDLLFQWLDPRVDLSAKLAN